MAHIYQRSRWLSLSRHTETRWISSLLVEYHGIPRSSISVSHGGGWLTVAAVPVFRANEMLGASYQLYQQSGQMTQLLRTLQIFTTCCAAESRANCVPTTDFASPRRHSIGTTADWRPEGRGRVAFACQVTPPDVSWLYRRLHMYRPQRTRIRSALRRDLQGPTAQRRVLPEESQFRAESKHQYTRALTYPTPLTFYSVGAQATLCWSGSICDRPAGRSKDYQHFVWYLREFSPGLYIALCDLFAQLGARGVSVLFPSGNDGVGKGACLAQTAQERSSSSRVPCILSLCYKRRRHDGRHDGKSRETAADSLEAASRTIFGALPTKMRLFQISGSSSEAIIFMVCPAPEAAVSLTSLHRRSMFYMLKKKSNINNGTSYSTPSPARLSESLAVQQPSSSMNDITSGSNPGCNTPGFSAIGGWDPVTGLGTPDFLNLQTLTDLMDIFLSVI
ncbi:hypothetical protein EI94DRAFT_1814614 [Lactarius quietus]|nr:hypothetical protein EI94DRAFT_1814614 [Lactarius quietus]